MTLRVAQPDDQEAMARFFAALSNRANLQRFFSFAQPAPQLIESFCDNSDPRKRLTLVVTRSSSGSSRIIATGSYIARDETTAEVAMAVDDCFQRKGIGMLLLERLAVLAANHGFRRIWALTMVENEPMLQVFRNSGFELHTHSDGSYVEIDFSVAPTKASVARAEMRDRIATAASIRPFFHPSSVAVVGASRQPTSIGGRILKALIAGGFRGPIYPVNPNAASVHGLASYPNVRALPEALDLAIVVVPRDAVLNVVDDCAARGVRAVVVISAGFAELGREGRELQQRLVEKIRGYGIRMIGPNCLGLLNTDPAVSLNASFSPLFPLPGHIALSSQSGALGLAILALSRERDLGLSHFVSVGNKADVSGNDLLLYWEEDPRVHTILLYLESFGNPRRFARIARRIGRRKPIIAVKAGRTGAGRRAAGSHTAALAASDVAVDALFHQTGVIRAETLDEMFDLASALDKQPLPRGRRVAILTNAGGLGILCADSCEAGRLTVVELSNQTTEQLKAFLPAAASVINPVDMIASASPEHYRKSVEILLRAEEVDALIVLYIDVALAEPQAIAQAIAGGVNAARQQGGASKPVYGCVIAAGTPAKPMVVDGEHVPNFSFPEPPARLLSKLAAYAEWRDGTPGLLPDFADIQPQTARGLCRGVLEQRGAGWLSGDEIIRVLGFFGVPQPPSQICRTADETVRAAKEIGFPVAVKLASRSIVHKTEVEGVRLHVQNETAARQAFNEIRDRLAAENKLDAMDGVLVQPMLSGGVELMIGVTLDPSFGPLLAFGLGGIHVEILRDVVFRVTPITDIDAREMVRSIRGYPLLEGYRGHPPADIAAIEDLLLRVARLVEEIPEISELDINPVFALPPGQGCLVADARIRVEQHTGQR